MYGAVLGFPQTFPFLQNETCCGPTNPTQSPIDMSQPAIGSFLILTIDAVDSLESLEDEIVTAACKRLTSKKYVGYVNQVR